MVAVIIAAVVALAVLCTCAGLVAKHNAQAGVHVGCLTPEEKANLQAGIKAFESMGKNANR
jgi:hypothetical protein